MQVFKQHIELNWHVSHSKDFAEQPAEWYRAIVPGAVQLDYARAHNWPPYWYNENFKDYAWMEDQFWTYKTHFAPPKLQSSQRLFFISRGIDYEFVISLNGEEIFYQEGMFKPVEVDVTDFLKESNELQITIFPAPKSRRKTNDKSQANQSVKPAVSYGWDWHPRLIPLGIWDDTFLEIRHAAYLKDVHVDYVLSEDFQQARITFSVHGKNLIGKKYRWLLYDPEKKIVFETQGIASDDFQIETYVKKIQLWWPHDQGTPSLYTSEFKVCQNDDVIDGHASKIGFRHIRLVMNDGAWDEPNTFPKTRSVPPIQLEINGRSIFAKGTNWVPPDIFPGLITQERYEELINLAVEANFNILRIWGGGFVNKESFYELCDEKGLLIWQDFPLACNNYEGTPDYLKVLESEAIAIIERLRQHACLALWCGGNELFNEWSRMTDQSPALRLLNSLCWQHDPKTPFIATTPLMGMGHGHYVFFDHKTDEDVFQVMARAHNTAYTEFGVPGPSNIKVLESFIPKHTLWPPAPGGVWESHHAFNAWQGDTWLMPDVIEKYFGSCDTLEQLVEYGQLLQSEGYKAIFEEARRQKPYCSMALNWCFNEPWPTAANNSILNWPSRKKPAFDAIKQACRPVLASARISKFLWPKDEDFFCELWMLNDTFTHLPAGKMTVRIAELAKDVYRWEYPEIPANTNIKGPEIKIKLPRLNMPFFTLFLQCDGNEDYNSHYILVYQ